MALSTTSTILFVPPDVDEAVALAAAARYLSRAGTAAGSRLLGLRIDPNEATLIEATRDSLLAGAALCDGLLDLAPETRVHHEAARRSPVHSK